MTDLEILIDLFKRRNVDFRQRRWQRPGEPEEVNRLPSGHLLVVPAQTYPVEGTLIVLEGSEGDDYTFSFNPAGDLVGGG